MSLTRTFTKTIRFAHNQKLNEHKIRRYHSSDFLIPMIIIPAVGTFIIGLTVGSIFGLTMGSIGTYYVTKHHFQKNNSKNQLNNN